MINDRLKELLALKARAAALEQQIAQERHLALAGLPAKYGFQTADDFIAAVRRAMDGRVGGGRKSAPPKGRIGRRKRRTKITAATHAQVKKLVGAGKTGAEIAKAVGISIRSVQNIKKALGLVKKRGK